MSKLLKRAKVQLSIANTCLIHFADDDAYMDACCYSLQQAIEITLKYIVEINNEQYAENHDVRSNLNKLAYIGVDVPHKELIRSMASTLYSWETDTRYRDDFVALKEDIDEAFRIARSLIAFADSYSLQTQKTTDSEYPQGRRETNESESITNDEDDTSA